MPNPNYVAPAPAPYVPAGTPGAVPVMGGRNNDRLLGYQVDPMVLAAYQKANFTTPSWADPSVFAPVYNQTPRGQSGALADYGAPKGYIKDNGDGTNSEYLVDGSLVRTYKNGVFEGISELASFAVNFAAMAATAYAGVGMLAGAAGALGLSGAAGTSAAGTGAAAAGTGASTTLSSIVANPSLAAGNAITGALGIPVSPAVATYLGDVAIKTAVNGGDVAGALKSATMNVGINIAGSTIADTLKPVVDSIPDISAATKNAITNGTTNALVAAATGGNAEAALAGAAAGYAASALVNQIPGMSDLPPGATKIATSAIAAELNGKDPTQAAINTALRVGAQAAASYADTQLGLSDKAQSAINSLKTGMADLTVDTSKVSIAPPAAPEEAIPVEPAKPPDVVAQLEDVGLKATDTTTPEEVINPAPAVVEEVAPEPKNADVVQQLLDSGVQENQDTDWASIYAQPSTDPVTGQTIVGADQSQYPVQDLGIPQANIDSGNATLADIMGDGGFTSQWQTSGSDRIQVNDDGSAIGINTETGDTYSLSPAEVKTMVDNKQLNTADSGYVAATGGTGNTPGGTPTAPAPVTKPSTPVVKPATPAPTLNTAAPATTPVAAAPAASVPSGYSTTQTSAPAALADIGYLFDPFGESMFAPNKAGTEKQDIIKYLQSNMASAAHGGSVDDLLNYLRK